MNKFHKVGTKHKAYIERFENKYKNISYFTLENYDKNVFNIISDDDKVIDVFTSKTTYEQFMLVMVSLGFIKRTASRNMIVNGNYNFELVTKAIFSDSEDKRVRIYRDSRKLCFLYKVGMLDQKGIEKKGIKKTKGIIKVTDIRSEVSKWEHDATKEIGNMINVLERIKNEH